MFVLAPVVSLVAFCGAAQARRTAHLAVARAQAAIAADESRWGPVAVAACQQLNPRVINCATTGEWDGWAITYRNTAALVHRRIVVTRDGFEN